MDWSNFSPEARQEIEFQLSLLRVISPGTPVSPQSLELERMLDRVPQAR
jgi:hypothetical protein